jgi:hypothetical protein
MNYLPPSTAPYPFTLPQRVTCNAVILTISGFSPVIRTNPVTGWKALYGAAIGIRDGGFDNLAPHESDLLKKYCMTHPNLTSSSLPIS